MFPVVEIGDTELAVCVAPIRAAFAVAAADLGLSAATCPSHPAFLTLDRLRRAHARGGRMFAVRAGDAVLGCCELATAEGFKLERLAVLPEQRRRGLGAALLAHAKAAAKAAGGVRLEAAIVADNRALKDWYLARGFRDGGERRFDHLPFAVGLLFADL